jgi:hypothetical protein
MRGMRGREVLRASQVAKGAPEVSQSGQWAVSMFRTRRGAARG